MQEVRLAADRFATAGGEVLESYDFLTSLIFTPGQKELPEKVPAAWKGEIPGFREVRWIGGEMVGRARPYLKLGASEVEADAALREAFEKAVDGSVELERRERE